MAKKTVNKSEAIRNVLATTPAASAKEVVTSLKQKGIDVSENLVYGVKQDLAKKAPKAKPATKAAAPSPAKAAPAKVAAPSSNGRLSVGASIVIAKAAAEKLGGWAELKEIVDAMV